MNGRARNGLARNGLAGKTVGGSICLLILSAGVLLSPAGAQTPPGDLHLEGDHWTAWSPPGSVPEGAQVHIVQPGDTLWTLAQRYLGDPHLWPQIWEQNQYVLDSHWIYPGDSLVMAGAAVADLVAPEDVVAPPFDEGAGDAEDAGAAPEAPPPVAETILEPSEMGIDSPPTTAPVPLGFEADIYCTGYVGDPDEEFPFRIAGSEYDYLSPHLEKLQRNETEGVFGKTNTEKYGLALGDIVYLDGGRAEGLSPGELLTAIQPRDELRHPQSSDFLGRVYAYQGRIRVLSVQEETAIAEIVQVCVPIAVGAKLKYFEPEPVPLRRITPMRPVNYPAAYDELEDAASIVSSVDNLITGSQLVTLGAGYLVLIDRGTAQDVVPGDIFTIYRRGREGFPPTVLGELGVLSAFGDTALARILRSRYAIYVGDPMLLK